MSAKSEIAQFFFVTYVSGDDDRGLPPSAAAARPADDGDREEQPDPMNQHQVNCRWCDGRRDEGLVQISAKITIPGKYTRVSSIMLW